jgi:hypothetical protein
MITIYSTAQAIGVRDRKLTVCVTFSAWSAAKRGDKVSGMRQRSPTVEAGLTQKAGSLLGSFAMTVQLNSSGLPSAHLWATLY